MSSAYKVHFNHVPHFITCTVIHWLEALSRIEYCDLIVESLNYCIREKGLIVHAWIIMPNHLHLIVSAQEGRRIGDIIRDFKKFTSRKLVAAIANNPQESRRIWMMRAFKFAGNQNTSNQDYQFWQQEYHPIELTTEEMFQRRIEYLHQNPVKAGIVWAPEHYRYSSAADYYNGTNGIIPLVFI
jgi:putative transposase